MLSETEYVSIIGEDEQKKQIAISETKKTIENLENILNTIDEYSSLSLKGYVNVLSDFQKTLIKFQEPIVREKIKALGNQVIHLLQDINVYDYHDLTIDEISQCYDRLMSLYDMLKVAVKVATHRN